MNIIIIFVAVYSKNKLSKIISIRKKSVEVDVALHTPRTVGYKWVAEMNGVKFEFNDLKHCIRKTILSEDGLKMSSSV